MAVTKLKERQNNWNTLMDEGRRILFLIERVALTETIIKSKKETDKKRVVGPVCR